TRPRADQFRLAGSPGIASWLSRRILEGRGPAGTLGIDGPARGRTSVGDRGRPLARQLEQRARGGESTRGRFIGDGAVRLESPKELEEARVACVCLVEEPCRLGLGVAADPLGLGLGFREYCVARTIGLARDGEVLSLALGPEPGRYLSAFAADQLE